MKRILSVVISAVLMVCLFSACNDKDTSSTADTNIDGYEGQYQGFETENSTENETTNANVSTNITSKESVSGESSIKESSSSKASSDDNNSGDNDSAPESTYVSPHKLPDYNINLKNLREFEQEDRCIKVVDEATVNDYATYVSNLLANGFTKYDETKMGQSQFTSLTNKTTFVSVAFTGGDNVLKVISESLGDLYPRKQDNKYTERNMQSLFTGMKNQNRPIYSGMGFVIRLSDGRFIVIDGGGGDYDHIDSNNLLNILKEQSPKGTEKPVIAAWIFTHAHCDHIGAFNAFSMDFADKVIVESFYYNFPPVKVIRAKTDNFKHDEYYSQPNFIECVNKYSGAKIIRPHAGEKIYIGNAEIEMLFSYEHLFPFNFEDGTLGDFNHSSLMFKINIGGQSMLITGDSTSDSMYFVSNNLGDYIESDILQMAHHGQNGTPSFYSTVNPTYVLVPISHIDTNRVYKIAANKWLVNSKKVRQFITFWGGNVTIPLPYNPTDDQINDRIPNERTTYYKYPLH